MPEHGPATVSADAVASAAGGRTIGLGVERRAPWLEVSGLPTGGPYCIWLRANGPSGSALGEETFDEVFVGDVWVLAGQSNMEGIGRLDDDDPDPGGVAVRMFGMDGVWQRAVDPLHAPWGSCNPYLDFRWRVFTSTSREEVDRRFAALVAGGVARTTGGVGPGRTFATTLAEATDVPVGLVPCALGGTSLRQWEPGFLDGGLFETMVERMHAVGRVRGVLWYQGETDALQGAAGDYADRLCHFVTQVRAEVNGPLPFIVVGLGPYGRRDGFGDHWVALREAQRAAVERLADAAFVTSDDLDCMDDGLHLTTASQRLLGRRLALAAAAFTPALDPAAAQLEG